jgi:hypothetical protein
VIDRLEDIGSYYYAASITAQTLKQIWAARGDFWDVSAQIFKDRCQMEGGEE